MHLLCMNFGFTCNKVNLPGWVGLINASAYVMAVIVRFADALIIHTVGGGMFD